MVDMAKAELGDETQIGIHICYNDAVSAKLKWTTQIVATTIKYIQTYLHSKKMTFSSVNLQCVCIQLKESLQR